MKTEIKLVGHPNCGVSEEREEVYSIETKKDCFMLKDSSGKVLISFNPFFNGGSIWITDFSDIIMDKEHWGDDKDGKFKLLRTESQVISNVSVGDIMKWKEDSEKLKKIREAQELLRGE